MFRSLRSAVLSVLLLNVAAPLAAQRSADVAIMMDAGEQVAPLLRASLETLLIEYPGVAFVVRGRNGALWSGAGGMADMSTGARFRTDTPISLYSLAKPMTAVLAMQLATGARLSLDDPIGVWPGIPEPLARITPRD